MLSLNEILNFQTDNIPVILIWGALATIITITALGSLALYYHWVKFSFTSTTKIVAVFYLVGLATLLSGAFIMGLNILG